MSERPNQSEVATCFAVQLEESPEPIDTASVPALSIFQAFTLYAIEVARDGRAWHALRLGFFVDANAAEHVVRHIRPRFAAASVVAVGELELAQADDISSMPEETLDTTDGTIETEPDETLELIVPSELWTQSS